LYLQGANEEEIDSVLSELGQAHSTGLAYDEDIGDDDQVIFSEFSKCFIHLLS